MWLQRGGNPHRRLVSEQADKISEEARNLGFFYSALLRWKAETAVQQGAGAATGLKVELTRLKTKNKRLKLERYLLKSSGLLHARVGDLGVSGGGITL